MRNQSRAVTMLTLGVDDHPLLERGVHLHWTFEPDLGFPAGGFNVFRRTHRPGTFRALDFSTQAERAVQNPESFGSTIWTNSGDGRTQFAEAPIAASLVVLFPGSLVTTCMFGQQESPVRRIEIDFVHWFDTNPVTLSFWGIAGHKRVAGAPVVVGRQNSGLILTAVLTGDALEGFQFEHGPFGILRLRWIPVEPEGKDPSVIQLNAQPIGLPLTAPGYRVRHPYSPDPGDGSEDWRAAAARMSPTGNPVDLPAPLVQAFGPPRFDQIRTLMREAAARRPLTSPRAGDRPEVTLDSVRMLLLSSINPFFARLLGLALIDRTAVPGERYDYKVVGYWDGPERLELDCFFPPALGTLRVGRDLQVASIPSGTRVSLSARWDDERAPTVRLRPGLELPHGFDPRSIPGVRIVDDSSLAPRRDPIDALGAATAIPERRLTDDSPVERTGGRATSRRSYVFALERAADALVLSGATGESDITVFAVADGTAQAVAVAKAGRAAELKIQGAGITSVIVSGGPFRIDRLCLPRIVHDVIEHDWRSFDTGIGPVPTLEAPRQLAGSVLPALSRPGRSAQAIGLTIEPRLPEPLPWQLLPLSRLPNDPDAYEVWRRADGSAPLPDANAGNWRMTSVDPETGQSRPVLRSNYRPADHQKPEGWPVTEFPDFIDSYLDPDVRYYSYRVRARDLFGRISVFSAPPVTIDAADRIPPPTPGALQARWIDGTDPDLSSDDRAVLYSAGAEGGVRVRWSWPRSRREEAPDAAAFRVYWNDLPFFTLNAQVLSVTPTDTDLFFDVAANAEIVDGLRSGQVASTLREAFRQPPAIFTLSPRVHVLALQAGSRWQIVDATRAFVVRRDADRLKIFDPDYDLQVALPPFGMRVPADAFAGDWLTQGRRQYLVRNSSGAAPASFRVSGRLALPPETGPCTVSLRAEWDPQRLQLLGNPLRPDPAQTEVWQRRVAQGPIVTPSASAAAAQPGVAVTIEQVTPGRPRPGVALVELQPQWRWAEPDPASWQLEQGSVSYQVLSGILGAAAVLVIDISQANPPAPGVATLRHDAHRLRTIPTDLAAGAIPAALPFVLVGGEVLQEPIAPVGSLVGPGPVQPVGRGSVLAPVLAHRTDPTLQIVVAGPGEAGRVTWYPDFEALLTDVNLSVSATESPATGMVGVSAVDDWPDAADRRSRPGEPTGTGNEGSVAYRAVQRSYRGRPGIGPGPAGAGLDPLWASEPLPFSGVSHYLLRWQVGGPAERYLIDHATLNAVLDADVADRAARRGAYAGTPELDRAQLIAFRQIQARRNAQDQRSLARAHSEVFSRLAMEPLRASDPSLADPQGGNWRRGRVPLDGRAPGRHFLRLARMDEAGNVGIAGEPTLPIIVPDVRRPPAPRLRRVIDGDRCVWIQWDADPSTTSFQVFRSRGPAGARPDVRDMTQIAERSRATFPQPVSVFGGIGRLPGAPARVIVAVYRAEDYDPTQAPDAQPAAPLRGHFLADGNNVRGLGDLADGTWIFVVVREVDGGPFVLTTSASGRAWCDRTVDPEVPYQYRVVALRDAIVSASQNRVVRSFPSEAGEGKAFDSHPPRPPVGTATWRAADRLVRITWPVAALPAGMDILVQRVELGSQRWQNLGSWAPAANGSFDDRNVRSRQSYFYRLRARNAFGRVSAFEPTFGPVQITA